MHELLDGLEIHVGHIENLPDNEDDDEQIIRALSCSRLDLQNFQCMKASIIRIQILRVSMFIGGTKQLRIISMRVGLFKKVSLQIFGLFQRLIRKVES